MPHPRKTLIYGGGSFARILIPYLERMGRTPDFIYDETLSRIKFAFPGLHLQSSEQLEAIVHECNAFFVAIGNSHGYERVSISNKLRDVYGLNPLEFHHPYSYCCDTTHCGTGCFFAPMAVINSYCQVGDFCIFNTNSSVDHESSIGNGVHVMGGATIAGRCVIGDFASIGTNSTILPDRRVGVGAIVGAGAVVTKDVEPYTTVVGVPARSFISKTTSSS